MRLKNNFVLDTSKFHSLHFNNAGNYLLYKNHNKNKPHTDMIKICDISNTKFIWDISESKHSGDLNAHCFLYFEAVKRRGTLMCCSSTESKVMLLNIVMKNMMGCDTKLSLVNKDYLNKNKNQFLQYLKRGVNLGKDISESEKSNHYLYFPRYTLFNHIAHVYKRKAGVFDVKMQNFRKVNLTISDSDINFLYINQQDFLEQFFSNNKKPPEVVNEIKVDYFNILCKLLGENLIFLREEEARQTLINDLLFKMPKEIYNGYCWSVSPCNHDYQYVICFDTEHAYVNFEKSFIISLTLFHFMNRFEKFFDKANNVEYLNEKIDRFITQNLADNENEVSKSKEELKRNPDYDKIYKVYRGLFKRPISNDLVFVKEAKKDLVKMKEDEYVEKFCDDVKNLKKDDRDKTNKILNSFDEKMFYKGNKNEEEKNIKKMAGLID
jgi:hypothetical protein